VIRVGAARHVRFCKAEPCNHSARRHGPASRVSLKNRPACPVIGAVQRIRGSRSAESGRAPVTGIR
jgi:hypothetical protein